MVASSVVGISPLLQGRNGYLPSIGWKDRVPGGYARKKWNIKEIKNRKERNGNPSAHKVMGLDPIPCIQLVRKPTNKQWRPTRTC